MKSFATRRGLRSSGLVVEANHFVTPARYIETAALNLAWQRGRQELVDLERSRGYFTSTSTSHTMYNIKFIISFFLRSFLRGTRSQYSADNPTLDLGSPPLGMHFSLVKVELDLSKLTLDRMPVQYFARQIQTQSNVRQLTFQREARLTQASLTFASLDTSLEIATHVGFRVHLILIVRPLVHLGLTASVATGTTKNAV
ncbi:hypothetical protein CROQUDRAFT_86544 [Cronartium quercuum f. sp. fusiforme G11]|uniref:Uncharacterized protein n=1 Tax=Cronartium quercuum f. sp. fusiforme G11 TaxID=708437 RepID=A0A9P6NQI7_9BASI|nr:hypothetical protein CROQUDRAFT_86544 [Cronartium quercuum f. sp. fusiforme G11]